MIYLLFFENLHWQRNIQNSSRFDLEYFASQSGDYFLEDLLLLGYALLVDADNTTSLVSLKLATIVMSLHDFTLQLFFAKIIDCGFYCIEEGMPLLSWINLLRKTFYF